MNDETIKLLTKHLRDTGGEYKAQYIEKFGVDNLCPVFWNGNTKASEHFYKKCVEEGHPWDWYFDLPDYAIL
jgi:hypothetical protein